LDLRFGIAELAQSPTPMIEPPSIEPEPINVIRHRRLREVLAVPRQGDDHDPGEPPEATGHVQGHRQHKEPPEDILQQGDDQLCPAVEVHGRSPNVQWPQFRYCPIPPASATTSRGLL
jgi:hypothetical protein